MKRLALLAIAAALGCAQFPSGQCTDKAVCGDSVDASILDGAPVDAPVDVSIDTLVGPDGDVPDGECNGGIEDCSNGIDDNCDGLADCADPLCQGAGYVCTPGAPTGWSGPVAFFSVAGGTVPSCGGAYATVAQSGHDGLTANPAQCGCSCSNPPTNVSCNTGVDVTYYSDGSCTTQTNGDGLPPNFCVNGGSGGGVKGFAQPTGYNGDCTATPSKNLPSVSWSNSYATCTYDGAQDVAGCTASSLCVQSPPSQAWAKPCIFQSGDVACPGAPYTQKGVLYTTVSDSRSCSTCACTASAGTCTATIDVYDQVGCTGNVLAIQTDGVCHGILNPISAIAPTVTTNAGTCGNNGTGGPTGAASATGPVTVCCTP